MYEIVDMQYEKEYDAECTIDLNLSNIINRPTRDFDLFIEFVTKESPNVLPAFLERLGKRLSEFDTASLENVDFEYEPKHITEYPEMFGQIRGVGLALLRYDYYHPRVEDGKVTIRWWDMVSSYLIPAYLIAESLVAIGPREKMLDIYKRYVDHRTDLTNKPDESITSIEDFHKMTTSSESGTHSGTFFLTANGAAGFRNTHCMWFEILKEFGDPELGYAVACYYDFHAAQYINKNFRLTRTKTLMQGYDICDFCWHDITVNKEMTHPPDEFWDKLMK